MTEGYRGLEQEAGPSRWLRGRWKYGSVYVLNLDNYICSPDFSRGLAIEWKHESAQDKTWTGTRYIGDRCGWHSARFVYSTASGNPNDLPTKITATSSRKGDFSPEGFVLDEQWFDAWICEHIGAEPRVVAA